jgi:hypothetical protein
VAHSRNEHVPLEQIEQCEARMLTWLAPAG